MMSSRCITPALGDRQSGPPLAEAAGHGETETNCRPRRTACRPGLEILINNVRSTSLFLSRTTFVTAIWSTPLYLQFEKDEAQFEKVEVQFEKGEAQFEKDEVQFEIPEIQFEKDETQIEKLKLDLK